MTSDFFDDSLDGLLSLGQDDEDFDPGNLVPKYLDPGGRDLLALSAALNAHKRERVDIQHHCEDALREEAIRSWQSNVDMVEDDQSLCSDILQLEHILHTDED